MLIPYGGLHFADVRLFKHEHAKAGLAYTSAYSKRQFAVEQRLMERQLRTFLAMRRSKLFFIDSSSTLMPMLDISNSLSSTLLYSIMSPLSSQSS